MKELLSQLQPHTVLALVGLAFFFLVACSMGLTSKNHEALNDDTELDEEIETIEHTGGGFCMRHGEFYKGERCQRCKK